MELTTTVKNHPSRSDTVTIALAGSLNTLTSPELEKTLGPVVAGPATVVIFDLAELKFISSAGIRVLVGTAKKLKPRGGKALMVNQQPQIAEVFKIIRSLPDVSIFSNVQEMDEYLALMQKKAQEGEGSR